MTFLIGHVIIESTINTRKQMQTHTTPRGVFFFAHVGWLLVKKHPDVREKGKGLDFSDLYADKIVMLQKRYCLIGISQQSI